MCFILTIFNPAKHFFFFFKNNFSKQTANGTSALVLLNCISNGVSTGQFNHYSGLHTSLEDSDNLSGICTALCSDGKKEKTLYFSHPALNNLLEKYFVKALVP